MDELPLPTDELFLLCLSRLIYTTSKDPTSLSRVQQFWANSPRPPLASQALALCERFHSSFKRFLPTHTVPRPPLPQSPPVEPKSADHTRIYMDGCFDLMHSGHFNAIRQAKALGKVLVVGVHSDSEITRNKGPPVMNEEERYAMVRGCKWVDEVIQAAPYSPTIELLDSLNCRYAAHGDDLSVNENGTDCMSILKRAGRCKIFKRTEGISTTQIVGKLLLMTREPYSQLDLLSSAQPEKYMLTTSRRISEFSNKREPRAEDSIVYMDGTFDLFHVGHVETLRKAKELGDYLVVGVHDDETVHMFKGSNFPIMTVHDRAMCVLSCKDVDEVVIGAPWFVNAELITAFNIKLVVQGTVKKGDPQGRRWRKGSVDNVDHDPYEIPRALGIYREVTSMHELDTNDIVTRIISHRLRYISKFEKTSQRENEYSQSKQFIKEIN